jgi:hypothetical protein
MVINHVSPNIFDDIILNVTYTANSTIKCLLFFYRQCTLHARRFTFPGDVVLSTLDNGHPVWPTHINAFIFHVDILFISLISPL